MPKRTDLKTILIIGAGPIIIGQACEFDYSGAQACKALRQEGYKVVLVNSNPATIMTDPDTADVTYIEPITWQVVEKIIAKERPDAVLPTMGGQTALNCALDLHKHGVLAKYGVEMIGANAHRHRDGREPELKFKEAMQEHRARIVPSCPAFAYSARHARPEGGAEARSPLRSCARSGSRWSSCVQSYIAWRRGHRHRTTTRKTTSGTICRAWALTCRARSTRLLDRSVPDRRLEGVRARGDPRQGTTTA